MTVSPNANALHTHEVFAHTVIPASSMTVPLNLLSAASVVADVGVQNTSQADAPPVNVISVLTAVFNVPSILKM